MIREFDAETGSHQTAPFRHRVRDFLLLCRRLENSVEKWIRDRPLPSAAIAAAAGFIIGGGMASRPGVAMLALLGRKAAKQAATNMISGMVRSRMR